MIFFALLSRNRIPCSVGWARGVRGVGPDLVSLSPCQAQKPAGCEPPNYCSLATVAKKKTCSEQHIYIDLYHFTRAEVKRHLVWLSVVLVVTKNGFPNWVVLEHCHLVQLVGPHMGVLCDMPLLFQA